jgi:hypothetical protein
MLRSVRPALTARAYGLLVLAAHCCAAVRSEAFFVNGRWSVTASNGATGLNGTPVIVTWSIAPDGTSVNGHGSDLVAFLDGIVPGGSGPDLTLRPWFPLIKGSFDRWSELGGLTFVYEPADDGVALGSSFGALGVRGDVRLGGTAIDGPSGTLAQTGFLNNADMTVDTADGVYYGASADQYLNLRNTFTHEFGHAFGLGHSDSSSAAFLMEAFSSTAFDGPQFDDVRGLQHLYGDANEKAHGGAGNNTFANATPLGALAAGQTFSIGDDATLGVAVAPSETDFVSVANVNDLDVYSFAVGGASLVDVTLTPTGPNYTERFGGGSYSTTSSSRSSDLYVELHRLDEGGASLVASASSAPLGQPEFILDASLEAGNYAVRIGGSTNTVQLYRLQIAVDAAPTPGDFDDDGDVDGADLLAWQAGLGTAYSAADLTTWQTEFGTMASAESVVRAVPEPTGMALAVATVFAAVTMRAHGAAFRRGIAPVAPTANSRGGV